MALIARPLLGRVSAAYDEAGRVPAGWISAIFSGVLVSAYLSMKSGVAAIFGAFVTGLVMPRRADLSHDVSRRMEEFVSTVLLPLFFVVSGLKMDVGLLNRWELWGWTAVIIGVAVAGEWLAGMSIARGVQESVTAVLVPLCFVVSGLKMDVGLLNRWELWGWTAVIIGVAVAGKWLAAMSIARVSGYDWRESAALGALMNTRGLTEL